MAGRLLLVQSAVRRARRNQPAAVSVTCLLLRVKPRTYRRQTAGCSATRLQIDNQRAAGEVQFSGQDQKIAKVSDSMVQIIYRCIAN
jgi:hypothetical protein